jgi:hypothetical protein
MDEPPFGKRFDSRADSRFLGVSIGYREGLRRVELFTKKYGDIFRFLVLTLTGAVAANSFKMTYFPSEPPNKGPAVRIFSVEITPTVVPNKGALLFEFEKLRPCSISDVVVDVRDIQGRQWVLDHNIRTVTLAPAPRTTARFPVDFELDFRLPEFASGTFSVSYAKCTDGADPKLPVTSPIFHSRSKE